MVLAQHGQILYIQLFLSCQWVICYGLVIEMEVAVVSRPGCAKKDPDLEVGCRFTFAAVFV